ncbi:MAG: hypothetical protein CL908_26230 [Deltaproteobacteria bacterium]|nr:hypothetical protein [Deltaproteobacteria bacterium]
MDSLTREECSAAASHDILDSTRPRCNALKARGVSEPAILSRASADTFRMAVSHSRRTYDDRIQEAICETGDRDLFPEPNIPRSTIRSWIHRGAPDVISCDLAAQDH